jgi:RND family efflux transporter MFP subunit
MKLRIGSLAALVVATVAACSRGGSEGGSPSREEPAGANQSAANEPAVGDRVTLSEAAYHAAGIAVEDVRQDTGVRAGGGIEVPGQVEFDRTRMALLSPRTAGRIERVVVVEGDRVAAGAPVAYLLSPAFLTAQTEFVRAVQRAERLKASSDADGARTLAEAARRRLRLLGVAESEIARLEGGGEPADLLAITAPFAGSIVEVPGLAGAAAEPGTPIATLADLSVLTVIADLPERAVPAVRIGQRATVRLAVLPGAQFVGRIERIRDQLDPATRTLKALIRVANPDHALKAGLFATVSLETSEHGSGLTIPASAVIAEGVTRYVFVEVAPRTYERRTVDVEAAVVPGLPQASHRVVIRTGLVAGDRVVTHGAFTLKSELTKSSFGEEQD